MLGLVAGIVGIGGGVYLVPLILVLRLGTEKEAAALFVFVNCFVGFAARAQHHCLELGHMILFVAAAIVGGTIGSYMGSSRFSPRTMEKILGSVILVAVFFLGRKIL